MMPLVSTEIPAKICISERRKIIGPNVGKKGSQEKKKTMSIKGNGDKVCQKREKVHLKHHQIF